METEEFRDEFGFTGPLPISSNQRRLPEAGFSTGPEVGERFPDFSLSDPTGRRVAFHEDRGDAKAAVVFLRSLVWSPACLTQAGELRDAWPAFRDAGVSVYTVSYDDREALAECAIAERLPFTLLSDPSSAVIWRLGLLNDLLTPADVPFYGVAFPGAYLLDASGVVTAKWFQRHMSMRVAPETIVDAAAGRIVWNDAEPTARAASDGVRITIGLRGGGGSIKMGAVRRVVARFDLDPGLALVAPPGSDATTPVSLEVSGPEGLNAESLLHPTATPHPLADGGAAPAWTGGVDLAVPVWANSDVVCLMAPPRRDRIALDVTLRYQLIEHGKLGEPRTERVSLDVPVLAHDVPNLPEIGATGHRRVNVESTRHFQRLMRRAMGEEPEE